MPIPDHCALECARYWPPVRSVAPSVSMSVNQLTPRSISRRRALGPQVAPADTALLNLVGRVC
eukprot:709734-Pyramimonas_sp.AAC.1